MAINTDKNSYTVIFAAIMVVVVGSILAFTASSLSGKIKMNEKFEKQQNILYAMGVNENGDDEGSVNFVPTDKVEGEFKTYIKEQIVLFGKDGKIEKQQTEQEYMDDNNGQEPYLIDIKKQETIAKKGELRKLPLFIGEKDGEKSYIIPMRGKGLWDAIWGFVAVDKDLNVQGVFFDHKGETPGLGANIKQRYFMDDFIGESILNSGRFVGITVAKGNNDPINERKEDNKVDALAGATITGNGVTAMIKESVLLYQDYLETIAKK